MIKDTTPGNLEILITFMKLLKKPIVHPFHGY